LHSGGVPDIIARANFDDCWFKCLWDSGGLPHFLSDLHCHP